MTQLFNKSTSQRLKLGHRYSGEFVSMRQLGQVVNASNSQLIIASVKNLINILINQPIKLSTILLNHLMGT